MSDYLTRLAARLVGAPLEVRPRVASVFEPAAYAGSFDLIESPTGTTESLLNPGSGTSMATGSNDPLAVALPLRKTERIDPAPVATAPRQTALAPARQTESVEPESSKSIAALRHTPVLEATTVARLAAPASRAETGVVSATGEAHAVPLAPEEVEIGARPFARASVPLTAPTSQPDGRQPAPARGVERVYTESPLRMADPAMHGPPDGAIDLEARLENAPRATGPRHETRQKPPEALALSPIRTNTYFAPAAARTEIRTGVRTPPHGADTPAVPAERDTINVTINRVEVRATPPSAAPRPQKRAKPSLDLDDYLRRRTGANNA